MPLLPARWSDGPPGPFRPGFWRSPLRGPWLASALSAALLPLIAICALTGFLSHAAYEPDLPGNAVVPEGAVALDLYFWTWPTSPAWLYALTQGAHVVSGIAAIPILLAKLWAVIPKLFEWPALRSPAHALERLSLALLVGGALFLFATGVLNIQLYYPFRFPFVPAHYYASFVFLGALALHVGLKLPTLARSLRARGLRPLREGLAETRPEPYAPHGSAPRSPRPATVSRRGFLAAVGGGSLLLTVLVAGQATGGPLRRLALLAPRGGAEGPGPNDFPVNRTAAAARVTPALAGSAWRLELTGAERLRLSRDDLLAVGQATERLPIACVEGWTTTQDWTGVRLVDLARLVGVREAGLAFVESLQPAGAFRAVTLSAAQAFDPRSLLALRVNGADLSLDHGFPARLIVPAMPGVHNTKWVASIEFQAADA